MSEYAPFEMRCPDCGGWFDNDTWLDRTEGGVIKFACPTCRIWRNAEDTLRNDTRDIEPQA